MRLKNSFGFPILDEATTCLCDKCNSLKSDLFPIDYYTKEQLIELSKAYEFPIVLNSRKANQAVVDKLRTALPWFLKRFLFEVHQVRNGKKPQIVFYIIPK